MKARTSRWGFIVSSALVFTLAVSITLGAIFYFYLQMRLYYRDLNQTRLDPLGLSLYPTSLTSKPLEGLPLILFYGDSRAELWPVPVEVDEYQFINRSISGQTSAQISLRFDSHVRPLAPEILLLHVGINDLKTIGLFPTKKNTIIENCQANIRQIVDKSTALGSLVILTTIFPANHIPLERQLRGEEDISEVIKTVNKFIYSLESENVIIFDTYELLADEDGYLREEYRIDWLHINADGYAALNEALVRILADQIVEV